MTGKKTGRENKPGAGRPPLAVKGKKVNVYLTAENVATWNNLPERKRSEFVNQAIAEKEARERDERGKAE